MIEMRRCFLFFSVLSVLLSACTDDPLMFAGGFTTGDEDGFYVYSFDKSKGSLEKISSAGTGPSPAYFCFNPANDMLYVANEVMEFRGEFGGGLTALKYNRTDNTFEKKGEMLIPYAGPCYISLSSDSNHIFIANYPNGSVAVVQLDNMGLPQTITDTILYCPEEPDRSHAHMILNNPSGERVYVTDLGLNCIYIYNLDKITGRLIETANSPVSTGEGSGPRHFTFNDDGSRLYVISELGSTVLVFEVEDDGSLVLRQQVSTRNDLSVQDNYCADIHLGKDGKFLYGSNRGENSIAVFSVGDDGLLSLAGHSSCGGDWPRNFTIDPSGRFLVAGNQKSDQVAVLKINRKTGLPGEKVSTAEMKMPACLKFIE